MVFLKKNCKILLLAVILLGSLVIMAGPAIVNAADRGAWAPNVSYAVGDVVTYYGVTYQCIQAHTSLTGWEPSNVPALWQAITQTPTTTPTPTPTPGENPLPPTPGESITTGTVTFHLLLGVGSSQDQIVLDGDHYTDLIMSNLIAGVMEGHLIREYYPGIQFNKDYLYGSIMGQLLQENLETQCYKSDQNLIDPASEQQAVMGVGQGGPYQINNYAVDMVTGSTAPGGYSLINFVTLQKNIGYTMNTASTQYSKATPSSFNNKYYSPMLTAYFHYLDFVALKIIGKGEWGWQTPWQPDYDNALLQFKSLPGNFLDVILNVAYNQGFYGGLVSSYSKLGATATASTIATVRNYSSVWGKTSTYEQYPYQVKYYLDQMYGNPIPTINATTFTTPSNHIGFQMTTLASVFTNVYRTLAYVNHSNQYDFIAAEQAERAFSSALSQEGLSEGAVLDLCNAAERAKIFSVLENATANLETSLGIKFNATTTSQL